MQLARHTPKGGSVQSIQPPGGRYNSLKNREFTHKKSRSQASLEESDLGTKSPFSWAGRSQDQAVTLAGVRPTVHAHKAAFCTSHTVLAMGQDCSCPFPPFQLEEPAFGALDFTCSF